MEKKEVSFKNSPWERQESLRFNSKEAKGKRMQKKMKEIIIQTNTFSSSVAKSTFSNSIIFPVMASTRNKL